MSITGNQDLPEILQNPENAKKPFDDLIPNRLSRSRGKIPPPQDTIDGIYDFFNLFMPW